MRHGKSVIGAGLFIAAVFTISLLAGCRVGGDAVPATEGEEFGMPRQEPAEPEAIPRAEGETVEPEGRDIIEDVPEGPEEVDIKDPDRAPDTVLATVDGVDILLQDIYDEFAGIPVQYQPQARHEQHRLLEHIIQQQVLIEKAREKEIEDTDTYKEMVERFAEMPEADELGEEELKEIALMEALLEQEVLAKVEISDEELSELFEQYREMMPEDITLEQIKPQLEQMLIQGYVEEYLQELLDDAEIERDEDWIEEKKEAAEEEEPPMMVP